MELPPFPPLNQRQMAAFLGIDQSRLERATHVGTVERRADKLYDPVPVTAQWLAFERARASSGKRRSQLEREKAALTRARRELVQLRLGVLRGEMVNVNETAGALKASCLRIRSRLQAALPRIARGCYYAQSLDEASKKVIERAAELRPENAGNAVLPGERIVDECPIRSEQIADVAVLEQHARDEQARFNKRVHQLSCW